MDARRSLVRSRRIRLAAVAAGALVTLLAAQGRAEQFVLFDATFTYTWDDAVNAKPSKSHYYVNEGNWLAKDRPTNWMSPVNYRDGKVHIRAEVIEKPPGMQQAGWALCYVANVGGYGCPYTDYYKTVGVYEKDVDMHTFYNNTTLQWDRGVKQVDLVYTVNGSGSGHITNFPELKDLVTPTKVRITMVQVSMGATYDPSMLKPSPAAEPGRDGGATGAGGSGGDASVAPDAGGSPTGGAGASGAAGTGGGQAGASGAAGTVGSSGGAGAGAAGTSGDLTGAAGTTAPPATGAAGSVGSGAAGSSAPPAGGNVRGSGGCGVAGAPGAPRWPVAVVVVLVLVGVARRRRSTSI